MGRLFGTDGVRGIANTELTCTRALEIGRAVGTILVESHKKRPLVVVGSDTRTSSDMLINAVSAGLCSVGANVVNLGVVSTPAVAIIIGKYKADAGIMISASHNPSEFNGIKVFSGDGFKLPDMLEERVEDIVLEGDRATARPIGGDVGKEITEILRIDLRQIVADLSHFKHLRCGSVISVLVDVGAGDLGATLNIHSKLRGAGRSKDQFAIHLINIPLLAGCAGIRADSNIGTAQIAGIGNFQNLAGHLVDDLIGAVAVADKAPILGRSIGSSRSLNIGAGDTENKSGCGPLDLTDKIGSNILGTHAGVHILFRLRRLYDAEGLSRRAVDTIGLHRGAVLQRAALNIQYHIG